MFPRFLIVAILFSLAAIAARAGTSADTAYTDRGKTDFDTVLQLLNPYGTWTQINGKWAYLPSDHIAPYTDGRWVYTEFGWYWHGRQPHSWATEHYGYWKHDDAKGWLWYPGPYWLPQTVEIRASSSHIGWRSGEVDDDGNFVEQPLDRFSKTGEWTFVSLAQFANPITPASLPPLSEIKSNLEESTDCRHTYTTYRVIDRPGPHPADFAALSKDGGMLAPKSMSDELPVPAPKPPDTNSPAAHMTGTNAPALIGTDIDPTADTRKVKYWVTMSLPTYWSKPPADAKPDQLYIYRPDIFQDQDGIERRISLWFNPKARTTLKDLIGDNAAAAPTGTTSSTPAIPATPAAPATSKAQDPFASPFDDSFHSSANSTAHSTNAPAKAVAPSGLNTSGK